MGVVDLDEGLVLVVVDMDEGLVLVVEDMDKGWRWAPSTWT